MSKITVIGSLNMDLVVSAPRIPLMGETILGSGFMTTPGGKGANQAVAASRLGGDVQFIGCVGSDTFGKTLIDNLSKNNVNVDNVMAMESTTTGVAVIVVKDGDNFIIVDPGANNKLTPDMVDSMENFIKDSYIVVIQLEIPIETVERAVEIAKRHNVKVLLNPAPARKLSDGFLSKIDVFTPNESECEFITGSPVKSIDDARSAVGFLMGKGISQVIVTMGSRGVVYNDGERVIHKPVPKVKVVDTTAAGDSFSGAVAVSLSRGMNINDAIDFANAVGGITVTRKGAQASLPTLDEVKGY